MAKNTNLHQAKNAKKDEFYTQLEDIENELKHYKAHFKDKIVYCNCDDPTYSNFHRYFRLNFLHLGLKSLITTHYKADGNRSYAQILTREMVQKEPKYLELGKDDKDILEKTSLFGAMGEGNSFIKNPPKKSLLQNGDFRSAECIKLLKSADIVVTNPPFSLFREYVAQLIEYEKKFVIIGNVNAITYKEIFAHIKDDKIWLGVSITSGDREFRVPDSYPLEAAGKRIDENGNKFLRIKGVRWFTNLDIAKRHEILDTIYTYKSNENKYPKYDNYDAINVDKVALIPLDYDGVMGVPITFLDKHNPKQFEIVALGIVGSIDFTCNKKMEILDKSGNGTGKFTINAKGTLYKKFNKELDKKPAFRDIETGELYSSIYARVIIRKIAEVADLKREREKNL